MERFAFIHGSSVGQSAFIPSDSPTSICNDIADKYFKGRILRQKESAAKLSLFVELYKSPKGDNYSVYSFVNNNCRGANGRDGQYLALTIICKNVYVYPEPIFRMLSSAYSQMFATGKIIGNNNEREEQYIISQFSDESEYLSIFLRKIEDVFDNISNGLSKALDSNNHIADYGSWHGKKVTIDSCNSMATLKSFCDIGRLYISEEYESSKKKIEVLEGRIKKLEEEKAELNRLSLEAKQSEKSKVRDELEELNSQIKEKDNVITDLRKENENYKTTIEAVRGELEKYAKLGKSITDVQNKKSHYQSKSKKDIIKICLLLIILILTIISSLMNYAFFRNISPFPKENNGMSENIQTKQNPSQTPANDNQDSAIHTSLEITPTNINSEANGGTNEINITTNGEWETPTSPNDWVKIAKKNDRQLSIVIKQNTSQNPRECTFMIRTGDVEKQIMITQKGKSITKTDVNYGVVVKDDEGKVLKNGTFVQNGQKLSATVTNPNKAKDGYGWKYYNCLGNRNDNVKEVKVTVDVKKGNEIIISYGERDGYREKIILKLKSTNVEDKVEDVDDKYVEKASDTNNTSTKKTEPSE